MPNDQDALGESRYQIRALSRAISILDALAENPDPALKDLSEATQLPKSTVVRILAVLEGERLVTRGSADGRFRLAYRVAEWAAAYWRDLNTTELLRPYLKALSVETGQTANVGVLDRSEVLHLCVVEADRPIRFRSADMSRDAAYCTGLGKALLSRLSTDDRRAVLRGVDLQPRTEHTFTSMKALFAELDRAREQGYAYDDEEGDVGVRCLGVAFALTDGGWAAVSVSGTAAELDPDTHERYVDALNRTVDLMLADRELESSLTRITDVKD